MQNQILRKIPGVDKLLNDKKIKAQEKKYGHAIVTFAIRRTLTEIRKEALQNKKIPSTNSIIIKIQKLIGNLTSNSLKRVINATGVILHTNLGRAPLGKSVLETLTPIVLGYSNLEYSLENKKRGKRDDHISDLLNYITKAEKSLIVNNNAAAVFLVLNALAKGKETIVSRGELIEIGGSFRIPDIMKESGTKMVEVGTTNKTRISDYENAINENTALIFKAHKSNYSIEGFTEEASLKELADLASEYNIPLFYDMGSGLLMKPATIDLSDEPDLKSSIESQADLVSFSCDKLLGGPQAGIIAGKSEYIDILKKNPLKRVLRIGKLTMATLIQVLNNYLSKEKLINDNLTLKLLNRSVDKKLKLAETFLDRLNKLNIEAKIIKTHAQVGGGTLPNKKIESYAIQLGKTKLTAKELFNKLHSAETPIISILREGNLLFEINALSKSDITLISNSLKKILEQDEL